MTTTQQHTPECLAVQKQRAAWLAKWPNYCRKCEGDGGFCTPSNYYEPGDYAPCECTEMGICPRCGQPDLDAESCDGPCANCGWNYNDSLPAACLGCGMFDDDGDGYYPTMLAFLCSKCGAETTGIGTLDMCEGCYIQWRQKADTIRMEVGSDGSSPIYDVDTGLVAGEEK